MSAGFISVTAACIREESADRTLNAPLPAYVFERKKYIQMELTIYLTRILLRPDVLCMCDKVVWYIFLPRNLNECLMVDLYPVSVAVETSTTVHAAKCHCCERPGASSQS